MSKTVTEAGFPSLAFFEMVAQIKPSADHVLVSLGGEQGRMEWRPYGGSGFVATVTFSWGIINVTSTYLNGATKSLFYFDDDHALEQNKVLPFNYFCTGQIWEFTVGTLSATVFTGIAAPSAGFPEPNFLYIRYVASYDSATDIYNLSTTESLLNNETNQVLIQCNNTTGSTTYSAISSNQNFARRIYTAFVETQNNTVDIFPTALNGTVTQTDYIDDIVTGTKGIAPSVLVHYLPYQKLKIQLTAAQINAFGGTPISLLPSLGSNKYYDLKIVAEYDFGTVAFVGVPSVVLKLGTSTIATLFSLGGVGSNLIGMYSGNMTDISDNVPLTITTSSGVNYTTGDGEINLVIYYRELTIPSI